LLAARPVFEWHARRQALYPVEMRDLTVELAQTAPVTRRSTRPACSRAADGLRRSQPSAAFSSSEGQSCRGLLDIPQLELVASAISSDDQGFQRHSTTRRSESAASFISAPGFAIQRALGFVWTEDQHSMEFPGVSRLTTEGDDRSVRAPLAIDDDVDEL
jgi:hypothetical protein